MKVIRLLATLFFLLAGIALLVAPLHAAGFVPTRFTVVDAGTVGKPDVVLIPGMASSRAVWDTEAKLLAPNYRLHLVQLDGFAGAPAGANATGAILPAVVEELHAYIVAEKMHPAVVGHSMGGLMTLMLADKYPADVRKMVIVDALPYYGLAFDAGATVESMKPQAEAIRQQMTMMPADQFAAMQPMVVNAMVLNEDARKLVTASSVASDRAVIANSMFEDLQTDLRADVATIKTPGLLLYPYDPAFQKDEAKYDAVYHDAYKTMPNMTLVRIDGSRHFIMYDQPEKMDTAIQEFLK